MRLRSSRFAGTCHTADMPHVHLLDDVALMDDDTTTVCRQTKFYATRTPLVELTDQQFRAKYRMTRSSFYKLHDRVKPMLREGVDMRGAPTTTETQLLCAIRFFATGTFQDVTGDGIGLSQSKISTIVKDVSLAIASLAHEYISLPTDEETAEVSMFAGKQMIETASIVSVAQEILQNCPLPSCLGTH